MAQGKVVVRASTKPVAGQYIVVFDDVKVAAVRAAANAEAMASQRNATILHHYRSALRGFSARMTSEAASALAQDPSIAWVEEDSVIEASATQSGATWGLDRIDQRSFPLDAAYSYSRTGAGVTAYIIDSGIRATHSDFGGRVATGFTAISDGRGTTDCIGHGTHVAGTVGGAVYGVAKGVQLVPVRVLSCDATGTNSGVIAGVDWVTQNRKLPAVANMSLGGPPSAALDAAVRNSIAAGISYTVAAGNDNLDACNFSPARVGAAITVGATTRTDARATNWYNNQGSNYGACVDLFAPGDAITSDWFSTDASVRVLNGTSMAAPHVTGTAALYLEAIPQATPADVARAVINGATSNVLTNVGERSPNLLLSTDFAPVSTGWGLRALNISGPTAGPASVGDPFAAVYANQFHALYRDNAGAIWDSYYDSGVWRLQKINQSGTTAGPASVGDPFAAVYTNQFHALYRDNAGVIWDSFYADGVWRLQKINQSGTTAGPASVGDPFVAVYGNQFHALYRDNVGAIWDSYYADGVWRLQKINQSGTTAGPASVGNPFIAVYANEFHALYRDGVGALWDSFYR